MIRNMTGDIFTSTAEALVNPVNCVGVMGKGLALEFKKRYPENFKAYKRACDRGDMRVGEPLLFMTDDYRYIVNFPTKQHWRDSSKLEWIGLGLVALMGEMVDSYIDSVAMPLLGCGLGGLAEADVVPLIVRFSESLPHVTVELWRWAE